MGFTLKHLRTGEIRTFSTKEVLEMLGDPRRGCLANNEMDANQVYLFRKARKHLTFSGEY